MENPLYLSFADFKKNYQNDLAVFLNKFPDATEIDFKNDLLKLYLSAVSNVTFPTVQMDLFDLKPITNAEYFGVGIIDKVLNNIKFEGNYDFEHAKKLNYSFRAIIKYLESKPFLVETETKEKPQQSPPPPEPENDFSDNKPKERIILLEKLGIIKYIRETLQERQETIQHTAEILSAITGIRSDVLYSYILPMLQPNRDDEHKNSPYKNPNNLRNANKTLHKLNIKTDFKKDADN